MDRQHSGSALTNGRQCVLRRQSPYEAIINEPRPQHQWDEFSLKHPKMSRAGRAKIFMPYDALKGYKEAVREKESRYENKRDLSDEEKEEINRKLGRLLTVCRTAKRAGTSVCVTVRYFTEVPLTDEDILLGADPYVVRGLYPEITGPVQKISEYENSLVVSGQRILFADIVDISGNCFSLTRRA